MITRQKVEQVFKEEFAKMEPEIKNQLKQTVDECKDLLSKAAAISLEAQNTVVPYVARE